MKKRIPLTERLLQKTLKESVHSVKRGDLTSLFLVNKEEIQKAMLRFNKKRIWEFMQSEGEFPGSYTTFLEMIKKYIEEPQKAQVESQEKEKKAPPEQEEKKAPEKKIQFEPQPIRHFIHNPNIGDDW